MVAIRRHACANRSQTAGFDGCRDCVLAVELHLDVDRSDFDPNHVLEEIAGHRLCEGLEAPCAEPASRVRRG
jgi:hypothetical protein